MSSRSRRELEPRRKGYDASTCVVVEARVRVVVVEAYVEHVIPRAQLVPTRLALEGSGEFASVTTSTHLLTAA